MNINTSITTLIGTLLIGSGSAQAAITDLDRSDFPAGNGPSAIAHGDFNQDGVTDLAIADGLGNAVAVLLGNGEGGFMPAVYYHAPSGNTDVSAIVAGDFDGDGIDDLAATTGYAGLNQSLVMILTSVGDGTFVSKEFLTGYGPIWIDTGDLDGDGDLDLVTANYSSRSFTRLYNDGEGNFDNYAQLITLRYPKRVALEDVDQDGDLDITISSNYGVMVYKVDATGVIVASRQYLAGTRPKGIAFGDINNDSFTDMLITDLVTARVFVFPGDGLGDFTAPTVVSVGIGPSDIALDDIDGDGDLDMLIAAQSDNTIQSLLNDSKGGFGPPLSRSTGAKPLALLVCDVNSDGVNDITTANYDADTISFFASAACIADFNGDGVLDFFDVSAFIAAFNAQIPDADLNGDGSFDFFDVSSFIGLFSAGCP